MNKKHKLTNNTTKLIQTLLSEALTTVAFIRLIGRLRKANDELQNARVQKNELQRRYDNLESRYDDVKKQIDEISSYSHKLEHELYLKKVEDKIKNK